MSLALEKEGVVLIIISSSSREFSSSSKNCSCRKCSSIRSSITIINCCISISYCTHLSEGKTRSSGCGIRNRSESSNRIRLVISERLSYCLSSRIPCSISINRSGSISFSIYTYVVV